MILFFNLQWFINIDDIVIGKSSSLFPIFLLLFTIIGNSNRLNSIDPSQKNLFLFWSQFVILEIFGLLRMWSQWLIAFQMNKIFFNGNTSILGLEITSKVPLSSCAVGIIFYVLFEFTIINNFYSQFSFLYFLIAFFACWEAWLCHFDLTISTCHFYNSD